MIQASTNCSKFVEYFFLFLSTLYLIFSKNYLFWSDNFHSLPQLLDFCPTPLLPPVLIRLATVLLSESVASKVLSGALTVSIHDELITSRVGSSIIKTVAYWYGPRHFLHIEPMKAVADLLWYPVLKYDCKFPSNPST